MAARSRPLWFEAARVGQRIAEQLRADAGAEADATWGRALHFLQQQWTRAQSLFAAHGADADTDAGGGGHTLDALCIALDLHDDERTLLLLAGMADAHEGYGAAFAALHPRGESRPTWGLFCWLVSPDIRRDGTLRLQHHSALLEIGRAHV